MAEAIQNISFHQKKILSILEQVTDPEIPVLTVTDLGIIRKVEWIPHGEDTGHAIIYITPTYSGCPAMDVIAFNIRVAMLENGYTDIKVVQQLSPAWSTDWMSEEGKRKLKAYGIAPPSPSQSVCSPGLFQEEEAIMCPHCDSYHTEIISRFGSTPCKALYKCLECHEPFDYFKCH